MTPRNHCAVPVSSVWWSCDEPAGPKPGPGAATGHLDGPAAGEAVGPRRPHVPRQHAPRSRADDRRRCRRTPTACCLGYAEWSTLRALPGRARAQGPRVEHEPPGGRPRAPRRSAERRMVSQPAWWGQNGGTATPRLEGVTVPEDVRRRPTLPRSFPRSTIGADRLSFRVRNETGRFPVAMAAVTLWRSQSFPTVPREPHSGREQSVLWQVVGLLVPVSYMRLWSALPHPAYQPSSLAGSLSGNTPWKPHLEAGFPLRCLQRLSLPNVANQPCSWRNNWHTRGWSVPVLSY
jgi:hypothetical protein